MEHIFAVSAIIQNAIQHGLPLSLTFLDLENAFGSVSHDLINDILAHIKLPAEIRAYVSDSYSKLCAYVATKNWSASKFQICKGVFQGDTLHSSSSLHTPIWMNISDFTILLVHLNHLHPTVYRDRS